MCTAVWNFFIGGLFHTVLTTRHYKSAAHRGPRDTSALSEIFIESVTVQGLKVSNHSFWPETSFKGT